MNNPQTFLILIAIFVLLSVFSFYTGARRMRKAREQGEPTAWYKQAHILTGLEYVLLTLLFSTTFSLSQNWIPQSLLGLVMPFYVVVLALSSILAFLVIRQVFINSRPSSTTRTTSLIQHSQSDDTVVDREHQAEIEQRRRERRKKAAAARRRRAGKA